MKTCQELRVHKISLQFVAPPGCPFYNPTNEKILYSTQNRVAYQQMKISATGKRCFNRLIYTNLADSPQTNSRAAQLETVTLFFEQTS